MSSKTNKPVSSKPDQGGEPNDKDNLYVLRLYVSGATPHSVTAIKNITELCDTYLADHFKLEIIDIYQKPLQAKDAQIIAVPTLIKCQPEPCRRLCGDMSKKDKVLAGLGIKM